MSNIPRKEDHDTKIPSTSADNGAGYEMGLGDTQTIRLEKPFNIWSTLGVSFSITSCPLAIGTYLSVSVGVGGNPVFFFGYIVAVLFNLCICASLAELAAVYPHSSGYSPLIPSHLLDRCSVKVSC